MVNMHVHITPAAEATTFVWSVATRASFLKLHTKTSHITPATTYLSELDILPATLVICSTR